MKILVECTWSSGEDVTVQLEDCYWFNLEPVKMKHSRFGICTKGQLSLRANEAEELAKLLLEAASKAREIEREVKEYFNQKETK